MKHLLFLFVMSLTFSTVEPTTEATVEGVWKTIDDVTGKARSHVKVYKAKNGKYYGEIEKLLNRTPDEDPDPVCSKCSPKDYRYNQKVVGMKILSGLEQADKEYKNGTILDPKNGRVYSCKIWLEDANTLKVRGYLGPIYRTQTWYRLEE